MKEKEHYLRKKNRGDSPNVRVSVFMPRELVKKAHEEHLNVSKICRDALKEIVGQENRG